MRPQGICADPSDNICVTGFFGSPEIDMETSQMTGSGPFYEDIFVVKYDNDGNELWNKSYGGAGSDRGNSVATDSFGNIFITGYFSGHNVSFGNQVFSSGGEEDVFLAKSDPDGNILWAKQGEGSNQDKSWSVAVDPQGNSTISGLFAYLPADTLRFENTSIFPPEDFLDPIFIAQFDPGGKLLCTSALPSGGAPTCGIASDLQGNIFLSGGASIAPFVIGADTMMGSVGPYIFTAKWSCEKSSGISPPDDNETHFRIYPNPGSGHFSVLLHGQEAARLEVFDMQGKKISSIDFTNHAEIDLSIQAKGIYHYTLTKPDMRTFNGKLVVE